MTNHTRIKITGIHKILNVSKYRQELPTAIEFCGLIGISTDKIPMGISANTIKMTYFKNLFIRVNYLQSRRSELTQSPNVIYRFSYFHIQIAFD